MKREKLQACGFDRKSAIAYNRANNVEKDTICGIWIQKEERVMRAL